ncbi:MAG: hypothetical protein Q9211_000014 [Gyalolechia sp. 1 TL-2023]
MKIAHSVAASAPLASDTYFYKILPVYGLTKLVAISSDDSLRLIDAPTLRLDSNGILDHIHAGVTSLKAFGEHGALTAGRDGLVKCTDFRTKKITLEVSKEYVECHNDDVTDLSFHPSSPSFLLSGSTDGLLNLYDTTIADEDEALTQVFNHGSSIAHADFLSDDEIFALSHDEVFSIYDTRDYLSGDEHDFTHAFGDLRPHLQCEYIVGLVGSRSSAPVLGAGSHRFTIPIGFVHH